jgi:hypothetical protein
MGDTAETADPVQTGRLDEVDALTQSVASTHISDSAQLRIGLEIEAVFEPTERVVGYEVSERSESLAWILASYHNMKTHDDPMIARMEVQTNFGTIHSKPDYSLWQLKFEETILPPFEVTQTACK